MSKKTASRAKSSSTKSSSRPRSTSNEPTPDRDPIQGGVPITDAVARHDQRVLTSERKQADLTIGGLPAAPRGPGHPPEPQPAASSVRPLLDEREAFGPEGRRAARANRIAGVDEKPVERLKVMATQHGYYDHARRRPGDVFTIDGSKLEEDVLVRDVVSGLDRVTRKKGEIAAFSDRWMKIVPKDTPEGITSGQDEILRKNADVRSTRRRAGQADTEADAIADRQADGEVIGR